MGLDLYIDARIKEKKTGRIITRGHNDSYYVEPEGFYGICWWCGWDCCDIRDKMIEICNSHAGTGYTNSDFEIPIPPSALRDIYAYIVKRCYLPEDEPFGDLPYDIECYEIYKWDERRTYERANLTNADKLFGLIDILGQIKYNNYTSGYWSLYKENIPNESDLRLFEDNPSAYEWEFRIWNSY